MHADWRTAPVRPELRAVMGFLAQLTRDEAPTADDAAAVLAAGVAAEALEQAVEIHAAFTVISKAADTFGFWLPEPDDYDVGARSLLRFGYIL